MSKKKFVALFMIFITVLAFLPTAEISASRVTELQRQLDDLARQRRQARAQIQESQTLLEGMRHEIMELVEIMQYYNQRIVDAYLDLEEIGFVLLQTELNMEYAEIELAEARALRDAQEELFRARLRAMHEQGRAGYLEVLVQSTSFVDFLVRLEHVRAVAQFDQEILETMEAAEANVASKVDELTRLHASFERFQEDKQVAVAALEYAQDANTAMLERMYEDEAQAQLLLELYYYEERALDELFGVVAVQLRAAEEEEARLAREAELRRQEEERQRALQQANLIRSDGNFEWPVPSSHVISSGFGWRELFGVREHHGGIDIANTPTGTRIVAAADGIVRFAGFSPSFGNYIIIDHCAVYSTLYAHNSINRVSTGQRVTRGQHIADVGSTGRSTGPHLHFEIRRNGVRVDPMIYFR